LTTAEPTCWLALVKSTEVPEKQTEVKSAASSPM